MSRACSFSNCTNTEKRARRHFPGENGDMAAIETLQTKIRFKRGVGDTLQASVSNFME